MDLSPEALELKRKWQREYMRKWRRKNPERNKAYVIAHWERKAEDAKNK